MNSFYAEHLTAGYGSKRVLEDVSFHAERGTVFGIAGPNGCGKSTLIKSICNLIPHQGTCGLDEPFERMNEKQLAGICSYLPQKSGMSADMSVLDTVLMAYNPVLKMFESPDKQMVSKALEVIRETGLEGKESENYMTLSGGEKQLCLLARAFVPDNPLLIMDEPENSLDPAFRIRIMKMVRNRICGTEKTALISLHDMNLALNCCDRILLMKEGKVNSFIEPGRDSCGEMERKLSELYGNICIRQISNSEGKNQLVMISDLK